MAIFWIKSSHGYNESENGYFRTGKLGVMANFGFPFVRPVCWVLTIFGKITRFRSNNGYFYPENGRFCSLWRYFFFVLFLVVVVRCHPRSCFVFTWYFCTWYFCTWYYFRYCIFFYSLLLFFPPVIIWVVFVLYLCEGHQ